MTRPSLNRATTRRFRPVLAELLEQRLALSSLGDTSIVEGRFSGADSVVVAAEGAWTATANDFWLHTGAAGAGNGLATFSFDLNSSAFARTGTLTIAGQTLTITQVGSGYFATNSMATLVSSGLSLPRGVAYDDAGNIYIADTSNNAVKKWHAATGQTSLLISSGLSSPQAVALDGAGNIYIADAGDNAIKKWSAATGQVSTLIPFILTPVGVALDNSGNVYFAVGGHNAIQKWNATTGQISTLAGLGSVAGVAVDASANVYIADPNGNAIHKWVASTGQLTTLISTGLSGPRGVAVDGSGNVYVADTGNNAVKKLSAVNGQVTTVSSGLSSPRSVAVDGSGNVAVVDASSMRAMPRAFVASITRYKTAGAGSEALAGFPVMPSTQPLVGGFAPTTTQSWLTVDSTQGNVISYSYAENPGASDRFAQINILGQPTTINQFPPFIVGTLSDNLSTSPLSLRKAIELANARVSFDPIADVIVIPTSLYSAPVTGQPDPNTIRLSSELPIVNSLLNLKVRAEMPVGGQRVFSISAENLGRVIQVPSGASLKLENLTLTNGNVGNAADGGAVANAGTLTLTNSAITNSTALKGGGIVNSGTLNLVDSVISGNTAAQAGGGVFSLSGALNVNQSTFSSNAATISISIPGSGVAGGGGIWAVGGGVSVTHSTFNGNTTLLTGFLANNLNGGGAIAVVENATLTVSDSTFTENRTGISGGAVLVYRSSANVVRSTFERNMASWGGGLVNIGSTSAIQASSFLENEAPVPARSQAGGSAIAQEFRGANMTIDNSTFAGNQNYAVIMNSPGTDEVGSNMVITNSTVVDNYIGIASPSVLATLTIVNSTIYNNHGFEHAVDVYYTPGTRSLTNCIIGRIGAGGPLQLHGVNLIESGLVAPGVINADPMLGPLQDNGGQTMTRALLPGSPAINAGVSVSGGVMTDQRGVARPQGAAPDLGAFERQATAAQLNSLSFEYETRQAVTFDFTADASLTFSRSNYSIQNLTTGQTLPSDTGSLTFNAAGTLATLVFTNLLPDGDYQVTSGGTTLDFHILSGDADRDRDVDLDDFNILATNFNTSGKTFSQGNFSYDPAGNVNLDDFNILAGRFGTALGLSIARAGTPASKGLVSIADELRDVLT